MRNEIGSGSIEIDGRKYPTLLIDGVEYPVRNIEYRLIVDVMDSESQGGNRTAIRRSIQSYDGTSSSSFCWKWEDESNVKKTTP